MSPFLASQITENDSELFIDAFDLEDTFIEPFSEDQPASSTEEAVLTDTVFKCNWNKCKIEAGTLAEAIEHFNSSHLESGESANILLVNTLRMI